MRPEAPGWQTPQSVASPPVSGLSLCDESWPPSSSIAGRVLEAVVARPISRVPKVPRRAGKDESAATGAAHLPGANEGSEPLPQSLVGAAIAACRRAPTPAVAGLTFGPAARAEVTGRDDLPVPTDAGGLAHFCVLRTCRSPRSSASLSVSAGSFGMILGSGWLALPGSGADFSMFGLSTAPPLVSRGGECRLGQRGQGRP